MPETIDDSTTNASSLGETIPPAFEAASYLAIPHERRKEATKRASFLIMRGERPEVALMRAQSGMLDDERDRDRKIDWEIVARISDNWRHPSRDANGHPREALFDAADVLKGMLDAYDDGETLEYREALKRLAPAFPTQESLDDAIKLYQHFTGIKSPKQIALEEAAALEFEADAEIASLEEDDIPWAVEDDDREEFPL